MDAPDLAERKHSSQIPVASPGEAGVNFPRIDSAWRARSDERVVQYCALREYRGLIERYVAQLRNQLSWGTPTRAECEQLLERITTEEAYLRATDRLLKRLDRPRVRRQRRSTTPTKAIQ